jgi:hypothetical protein
MDGSAAGAHEQRSTAGPERPTLVERVLGLLPMPYVGVALLMAAVLGPPGSLLIAYLETGDLAGSLESFFYGYIPARLWQRILSVVLWYAFYTILFWAIRHARISVLKAEAGLKPLLSEPDAFRRAFGSLSRLGPALLVGLLVEVLFIGDYRARLAHAPGTISRIYEAASGPPLYVMVGTALWVYGTALWGLYRLGRGPLRLKPFYEDRTMGLRPLASLSLSLSLAYFVLLLIMVLMLFIGPVRPEYVGTVIALLLLGVGLFFLPLLGAHRRMKEEKDALKKALQARWGEVVTRSLAADDDADATASLVAHVDAVVALQALDRKVATVSTWPLDTSILSKLGVMIVPVLIGLLTQLAANLLGL